MTPSRGYSALGMALDELVTQHGTQTALARVIGCGIESLGRWIRGDAKPAPKYAESIRAHFPGLGPLLEQSGCFVNPAQRPRVFAGRPVAKSEKAKKWRERARKTAAKRAVKAKRLDLIRRRHKVLQREARA